MNVKCSKNNGREMHNISLEISSIPQDLPFLKCFAALRTSSAELSLLTTELSKFSCHIQISISF